MSGGAQPEPLPHMSSQFYASGEQAPASGIYRASHLAHRHDHYVTCLSGASFPLCRTCGNRVRFTALQLAHRVDRHAAFLCEGREARPHRKTTPRKTAG
jgi:hypothetical protein